MAQWPSEVKADLREAIIANRKYIIEDVKALYSSKLEPEKFFSTRATPDIAFEDPLERFEGRAELVMFMNMCKYLDGLAFKINKEVHSTHEMVYDWEISVSFY